MELGHGPHDLFARGIAELDQAFGHLAALLARHLFRFVELVAADDAVADQDLAEVVLRSSHSDFPVRLFGECQLTVFERTHPPSSDHLTGHDRSHETALAPGALKGPQSRSRSCRRLLGRAVQTDM